MIRGNLTDGDLFMLGVMVGCLYSSLVIYFIVSYRGS